MAPYSSTLAWKIPGTEEPGRLQSMGSQSDMTEALSSSSNSSNEMAGWHHRLNGHEFG